jgi:hypothetical protein
MTTYLVEIDSSQEGKIDALIEEGAHLYTGGPTTAGAKVNQILKVHPVISHSKGGNMAHVEADYPIPARRITIEPKKPDAITRLARVITVLVLKGLVTEADLGMPRPLAFGEFVMQADIEGWLRS